MTKHASLNHAKTVKATPLPALRKQPLHEAISRVLSAGLIAIAPLGVGEMAHAAQLAPNPNPAGNTIVVSGADSNAVNPFSNLGDIQIQGLAGTLTNQTGATLENSGAIFNSSILINQAGGTLINQAGGTLANNSGSVLNYGTLTNQTGGTLTNNYVLRNYGTLTNQTGGTLTNNDSLLNYGTLANAGTLQNNSLLRNNAGALIITSTGTLSGPGTVTQTAGSTVVDGTLGATTIDIQGGALSGSGTLNGPVTLAVGASVNPGNPTGTLTVNGAFTLNGDLVIELLSTTFFDVLNVLGAVSFGPTSSIAFQFGFTPSAGDTFEFLQAGSVSGFNQVGFTVQGLPAGLDYQVLAGPLGLTLALEPGQVPEPAPLPLLLSGFGGLALVEWLWRQRSLGRGRP